MNTVALLYFLVGPSAFAHVSGIFCSVELISGQYWLLLSAANEPPNYIRGGLDTLDLFGDTTTLGAPFMTSLIVMFSPLRCEAFVLGLGVCRS